MENGGLLEMGGGCYFKQWFPCLTGIYLLISSMFRFNLKHIIFNICVHLYLCDFTNNWKLTSVSSNVA